MLTETRDRREVSPILKISNFSNSGSLAEDVFDFVEERGVAVGRLVVNSDRVAELFHQFALLAQNATEMMRGLPFHEGAISHELFNEEPPPHRQILRQRRTSKHAKLSPK